MNDSLLFVCRVTGDGQTNHHDHSKHMERLCADSGRECANNFQAVHTCVCKLSSISSGPTTDSVSALCQYDVSMRCVSALRTHSSGLTAIESKGARSERLKG